MGTWWSETFDGDGQLFDGQLFQEEVEPSLTLGTEAFPVYYQPGSEPYATTLDPYAINMRLDYGPISVYNDDRTIPAENRATYTGWYFRPSIEGATISLYEGDVIVMYVQIQNPFAAEEFESWSCSTTFQQKKAVYVGEVYNYSYGSFKLDYDAVERDSANPSDQTTDHPEYMRNGPWFAADALSWYTQKYNLNKNYSSVGCTAVRQYGAGQKGFFDLPIGDTITLNMGYRVYDSALSTSPRVHRDYNDVSFVLLDDVKSFEGACSSLFYGAAGAIMALTALSF